MKIVRKGKSSISLKDALNPLRRPVEARISERPSDTNAMLMRHFIASSSLHSGLLMQRWKREEQERARRTGSRREQQQCVAPNKRC